MRAALKRWLVAKGLRGHLSPRVVQWSINVSGLRHV